MYSKGKKKYKKTYSFNSLTEQEDTTLQRFLQRETNDVDSVLKRHSVYQLINYVEKKGYPRARYNTPWTDLDDELVAEYWNDGVEIAKNKLFILGRSLGYVKQRAEVLGYKPTLGIQENANAKVWTEEEIDILKRDFPIYGSDIYALLNSGRSRSAIEIKADKLGLTRVFKDEEDEDD